MTINGKELQLRFGTLAVRLYLNEMAKEEWVTETYSSFGLTWIIYSGMLNYYEVKREKKPVTFEEIYNYVESIELNGESAEEIQKAVKEFEESQALKVTTEKINATNEELKKKLIGTNLEKQVSKPASSRKKSIG